MARSRRSSVDVVYRLMAGRRRRKEGKRPRAEWTGSHCQKLIFARRVKNPNVALKVDFEYMHRHGRPKQIPSCSSLHAGCETPLI